MKIKIPLSFFNQNRRRAIIDDFDQYFRDLLLESYRKRFQSVADAKFYLALQGADLQTTVNTLIVFENTGVLETSIANALFYPVGCGDIANTFCLMMINDTLFTPRTENPPQLPTLTNNLGSHLPKLIRVDIPGHSYVMLACDKTDECVFGYIYQSNISQGMEDNSFSLAAWLKDHKSQKTNLTQHLKKVNQLLDVDTPNQDKAEIYRELFFAKPLVEVNTPANLEVLIKHINGNSNSSRYKIKHVTPKQMLSAIKRFEIEFHATIEERLQSLDEFIHQSKETLNAMDNKEQDTSSDLLNQ